MPCKKINFLISFLKLEKRNWTQCSKQTCFTILAVINQPSTSSDYAQGLGNLFQAELSTMQVGTQEQRTQWKIRGLLESPCRFKKKNTSISLETQVSIN